MKKYVLALLACLLIGGSKVDAKTISLTELANQIKTTTSYTSHQQAGYSASITTTDTTLKIHAAYNGSAAAAYSYDINFTYNDGILSYKKESGRDQWRDSNIAQWLADVVRSVGNLYGFDETKIVNWFNNSSKEDLSKLTLANNGVKITFTSYTCGQETCRYYEALDIDLKGKFNPFEIVTDGSTSNSTSSNKNVKTNPKTADLNISVCIASALVAIVVIGYSALKINRLKKSV